MMFLVLAVQSMPNATDRNLQRELNRIYSKNEFTLMPMKVPEKFNLTGTFYQIQSSLAENQLPVYVYIGRVSIVRSAAATISVNNITFDVRQ